MLLNSTFSKIAGPKVQKTKEQLLNFTFLKCGKLSISLLNPISQLSNVTLLNSLLSEVITSETSILKNLWLSTFIKYSY